MAWIVSLFCCGWWIPVWLLMAALGGEKRATVSVDQYGNVNQHKAPMEPYRIVILVVAGVAALLLLLFWGSFMASMLSSSSS